jgi:hydroxymethylpyrimidine pyrophosphatase-like HAD family hydrolase
MKPILEGRDYLYMDMADFAGDRYAEYVRLQMGDALRTISGNRGNWEISKLSCDMKDADKAACFAELERDYTMIVHNEAVVEMVPKGFDKGTGIREVCDLLDTDIQGTYAFGNSMNDFEMIEAAGCGVVMGGGADVVKEKADFVTKELREDGIYYACRELGLL